MDLKQATVTIPYEEFQKYQEMVKEIEWARDFKKLVDKGEFFPKKDICERNTQLIIFGAFILQCLDGISKIENFGSYISNQGYVISRTREIHQQPAHFNLIKNITKK